MSYLDDRLSVLAYANGFTLWHFKPDAAQADRHRTLDEYLASAGEILRSNDLIVVDPVNADDPAETDPTGGGIFRVRVARRAEVRTDALF
ncbi:hypothetical protein [Fodinicurvata sp. EGI_FJ10296]|uniref:hypothetical protein n=1 Tax=Fodinicurvata sp. EGI_FJ10296 TaxID=3231908 RepID=UPI00345331EE